MSETEPFDDIDPSLWADPATTYDKVAAAYAAAFLRELDHKPFDRDILSRFAAATRGGVAHRSPRLRPRLRSGPRRRLLGRARC